MNNNFDIYLTKILKDMEQERSNLSHPFVGSEHLLLSLLKNDKTAILLFSDYNVTYDTFLNKLIEVVGTCKKNVDFNLYTPLLKRVINYAIEEAKVSKEKVNSKFIIESLLEENEGVAIRILNQMDVDLDELYRVLNDKEVNFNKSVNFGKNLNDTVLMEEKVIGRDKEINFIIETLLRKNKNNPLLIGEAGVGKSAIIEELARSINKGLVPKKIKNSKIISLDMSSLVAGTKYRGEFEEKLNKIIEISEKDSNIILFIDEIHTISNAGGAEGAIGAGDIFKPYLARGSIKVIGATTFEEYEKYILKDKALSRRFETIIIKEPTVDETIDILKKIKIEYENFHNVSISNKNILDIVSLADKFIVNRKNPDKSIDFLDSIASYVQIKNDNSKVVNKYLSELKNMKDEKEKFVNSNDFDNALKYHEKELYFEDKIKNINSDYKNKITLKDIYKVLETKTSVPCLLNKKSVKEEFKREIVNLLNKEDEVQIIKMFNEKIDDLGILKSVLVRGNATKLIESFSKVLKKINMIKINGEDYTKEESIIKLIGNYQGYASSNDFYIFKSLKINPFCLIYIENYDLFSNNIKNLFQDIMKNTSIKDDKGNDINFKNSIIIASVKSDQKKKVGFNNLDINKVSEEYKIFNNIININNTEKIIL